MYTRTEELFYLLLAGKVVRLEPDQPDRWHRPCMSHCQFAKFSGNSIQIAQQTQCTSLACETVDKLRCFAGADPGLSPPPLPASRVGHPDNLCLAIQLKQGRPETVTRSIVHTEELWVLSCVWIVLIKTSPSKWQLAVFGVTLINQDTGLQATL